MIDIPPAFLPFDPNRDINESDDEDEDESYPDSDEESSDNTQSDSMVNGETKATRHIGGGVILVSRSIKFSSLKPENLLNCRVRPVNVFWWRC